MKNKKIISVLLTVLMVAMIIPIGLFAASADYSEFGESPFYYVVEDGEASVGWYDELGDASKDVVIPSQTNEGYPVTKIFENGFSYSDIESVTIPASIKIIDDFAFDGCTELKQVNFSEETNLEYIGYQSFGSTKLTNVEIPEGVETLGMCAFIYCSELESLKIPSTLTTITELETDSIVSEDNKLTTIIVDENNPVYDSRDNCNAIIETASNKLLFACKNTVIPSSVEIIASHAYNIYDLESVFIPSGVKQINGRAFNFCESLNSVSLPSTLENIDDATFYSCNELVNFIYCDEGIYSRQFVENYKNEYANKYKHTKEDRTNIDEITFEYVEHKYEVVASVAPTCFTKGYNIKRCEHCGDVIYQEYGEKLNHHFVDGECEYCHTKSNGILEIDSASAFKSIKDFFTEHFGFIEKFFDFIKQIFSDNDC